MKLDIMWMNMFLASSYLYNILISKLDIMIWKNAMLYNNYLKFNLPKEKYLIFSFLFLEKF